MICELCRLIVSSVAEDNSLPWFGGRVHESCGMAASRAAQRSIEDSGTRDPVLFATSAFPHPSKPTIDAIMREVSEALDVPEMDGETREEWKRGRAGNITQIITSSMCGGCPVHGPVPMVEYDADTLPVPIVVKRQSNQGDPQ